MNDALYPLYEAHVHLTCDGLTLHADGLPSGPDSLTLPSFYHAGLCSIYTLLDKMLPDLSCISVLGIWRQEAHDSRSDFIAFDLWAQQGEEGFYLPMKTAQALFSQHGIPYFHLPVA